MWLCIDTFQLLRLNRTSDAVKLYTNEDCSEGAEDEASGVPRVDTFQVSGNNGGSFGPPVARPSARIVGDAALAESPA